MSNSIKQVQCNLVLIYLHNHPIGSFTNVLQISVSGAHFKHLASNYLRVGISARGTCSLGHRDALRSHLTTNVQSTNSNNSKFSINSSNTADTRLPFSQLPIHINYQNKLLTDLHYPLPEQIVHLSLAYHSRQPVCPTSHGHSRIDAVPLQNELDFFCISTSVFHIVKF